MLKDPLMKKIVISAMIITLAIALIFVIVAFWDWHLLIGWLCGCLVTIGGFLLNAFLIKILMQKVRTKSAGFWIGWARAFGNLILQGSFFVMVLLINTSVSNRAFQITDLQQLVNPINLFTYLAGLSIIAISIMVVHFGKKEV